MRIYHNMEQLRQMNQLNSINTSLQKVNQRLVTGKRINSQQDDQQGLQISTKLQQRITSLQKQSENVQNQVSFLQTQNDTTSTIKSMLNRMKELQTEQLDETKNDSDRQQLQEEFKQLYSEINQVQKTQNFNGIYFQNGDYEGTRSQSVNITDSGSSGFDVSIQNSTNVKDQNVIIQVGQFQGQTTSQLDVKVTMVTQGGSSSITTIVTSGQVTIGGMSITWDTNKIETITDVGGTLQTNEVVDTQNQISEQTKTSGDSISIMQGQNQGETVRINIGSLLQKDLGLGQDGTIKISTIEDQNKQSIQIDGQLSKLSKVESKIGQYQNRLSRLGNTITTRIENLTQQDNVITGQDMQKEQQNSIKLQLLQQTTLQMLSQQNMQPQMVLSLFR